MTKKDKRDYFLKTLFLAVFGLVIGFAAIYTLVTLPITFLTVVYAVFCLGGATFCGFMVKGLIKEYISRKKNES